MKSFVLILSVFFAGSASALTREQAEHFLLRTGFDAPASSVKRLLPMSPEQAVDDLLSRVQTEPLTPPPAWSSNLDQNNLELKAWWYREMISTPSPFTEHLTMFWHNHFTSSLGKARWPVLLYRQNLLLRRDALGNFRDFLLAICRDPAMVIFLDTQTSRAALPNENFARELLELYTLGEGRYSEEDVRSAARAFTGWRVNPLTGVFMFQSAEHDHGRKVFMGQAGPFNGDDILGIILARPEVAEFITSKLWKEFVSDKPEAAEIHRLAMIFIDNHYELRPLVRATLLSPAFWDPKNFQTMTKSPVELMVGTTRALGLAVKDTTPLVIAGRDMGQDIMDPPNAKGWPGGPEWINTQSLFHRQQFLTGALAKNSSASLRSSLLDPAYQLK